MTDPLLASYESVPYQSRPIALADPDSIAANAILHGVTPPPPDRARVLELGCASGGNLLSMAFALPKSRFVGIDLSPSQIAVGQYVISEMGLQNVTLEAKSLEDIGADLGKFDYIICHGVYSWVPPNIQEAILEVCSTRLAPHGIAYVSYNTYPGWRRREMLRDMLLFHDDHALSPAARVARAREFANFLRAADPSDDSVHARMLRDEVDQLQKQTDHHIFHEQLEPYNNPVYFGEFARRAAAHGLRYLAEAKPTAHTPAKGRVEQAFESAQDIVQMEQYVDFVLGRTFRRTLLCHDGIQVASGPLAEAIPQLMIRSRAVSVAPAEADAARGPGVEAFRTPNGVTMTTNNPLVIAVLRVLGAAAPVVMSFEQLQQTVCAHLSGAADEATHRLGDDHAAVVSVVLQCASSALVEFRTLPSKFVATAGKRPKASAFARWQALHFDSITSLGHWPVEISGMERFLLPNLDGTNDRAQLIRLTEHAFTTGDLRLGDVAPTREQIADVINDVLARLGRSAVLVA
ncbi:MAG TPA: class I SAM-dependent methyltransferase [Gemmatimonadaceae bacterium]|nr:class I SAM-dependent methyltransferase [Gemmatimonadaceae bacterium]